MKVTEVRFTRRYNVGQYEHEEYTVVAQPEEGSCTVEALAELKSSVEKAYAGEQGGGSGGTASPANTSGKGGKKSKPKKKEDEDDDSSDTDSSNDEEAGDDETENDSSENDSETEEENTETEEQEDTEDEDDGKKTPSKGGSKDSKGGKKFKSKAQVYQRTNETHKDIFSGVLKKIAPNWKKSFESKSHAKKVSAKMNGKEFLDDNGKVLAAFEAETKKQMGKFAK